jgi:rhodanese-related sulfurtransferase
MSLQTLSADEVRRMVADGAVLIDVREVSEFNREHIDGAVLLPLSTLDRADFSGYRGRKVIFHCQSGGRTSAHARRLAAAIAGSCDGYVLGGGILAWRRAGLETAGGTRRGAGLLGRLFGR